MFKGKIKIIVIFSLVIALITTLQLILPKPIDWTRNYQSKKKTPFGTYAIHNLLKPTYARQVTANNQTFYNLQEFAKDSSTLIFIDDELNFSKVDFTAMYKFLKKGNSVFITASSFSGILADSLKLNTIFNYENYYGTFDSLFNKNGETLKFCSSNLRSKKYQYSALARIMEFSNFDSTLFKSILVTESGKAVAIKADINGGQLIICCAPDIFANYFIANKITRPVAYHLLSYIDNKYLVWDENYKRFNEKSYSPLKFIFGNPTLHTAYLLTLITLILYMIFEGRRRQRIIPQIEPNTNTTLEFVNVISHVYYNSQGHQNIAQEKIKYFYETIRKRFNVNTSQINQHLINEVSILSGVEEKIVKNLFNYCEKILKLTELSDLELIELNRQIYVFNKNSIR
jgi:hypothetical protein